MLKYLTDNISTLPKYLSILLYFIDIFFKKSFLSYKMFRDIGFWMNA